MIDAGVEIKNKINQIIQYYQIECVELKIIITYIYSIMQILMNV